MTELSSQTAAAPPGFSELELIEDHGAVVQYSAVSQEHGRRVGLWRIPASVFGSSAEAEHFDAVVRSAKTVGSALVSPPLSMLQTADGTRWLACNLVSGMTLEDTIALRGKLEADDVVQLAQVLSDALTAVHEAGTVHHGLRPTAVLVSGEITANTVRLADLALGFLPLRGSMHGQGGVPLLAPSYAAPECIQGAPPSPASDVYALGTLLYTALTGAPPFRGSNAEEVLQQQCTATVPPLPEGVFHLGPAITACLEKDPARRPPTAREVARILGRANQTLVPPSNKAQSTARVSYPVLPPLPLARPGEEAPGDMVGQYKLTRLIGEGAMGRVFLAQHMLLGRQVALKILRPEQYKKEELIQRFFQEARTVNQINHEHIVEIIDFVVEPDAQQRPRLVYCVMEFLEGTTLTEAMEKGAIDIKRGAKILSQVCGALAAAHKVGVVHRDVKPDNVFLTARMGETDYVKVLDFGVAKLTAPVGDAPLVSTMDGALIGTPVCMSPEQAAGKPVDHRTDIYAAGIMLYELLSGSLPFNSANFGALAVEIITKPPPPLPERTRSGEVLPASLRELVMRCLDKDAARRPQTMNELREALDAVARGEALPSEADAAAIKKGPSPMVFVAAAIALLAVGGGIFALTRPGPTEVKVEAPPVVEPPKVEPPPVEPPKVEPVVAKVDPPPVEPPPEDPPAPVEPPPQARTLARLTPKDIQAVVARNQKGVQACLKRHRANLPESGNVKVAVQVEPGGKVSSAKFVGGDFAGTPFGDCVTGDVSKWLFPKHKQKTKAFAVPFAWNFGK